MTESSTAIIIVNFNAGEYLLRCLNAVKAQTVAASRVIVVDNNSSDHSISAAKQAHPWVEYVELQHNTGFAAANNAAVAIAEDVQWVALLNPDAFVESDWLEQLLVAAQKQPDQVFFASKLISDYPNQLVDGLGDCYHQSGLVWRIKHGAKLQNLEQSQLPVFSPCAAAALYSRAVFKDLGGFDEDYFCYIEDIDLVFRMRLAGYQGGYVPEAVATHIGSAITQKESDFSVYHGHRNLVWTYAKNMPAGLLFKTLPQHILLNLFSLLYYTLKGRPKVIFKAKWHAIKGLSAQLAKRRRIQQAVDTEITRQINSVMADGWLTPYLGRNR